MTRDLTVTVRRKEKNWLKEDATNLYDEDGIMSKNSLSLKLCKKINGFSIFINLEIFLSGKTSCTGRGSPISIRRTYTSSFYTH